MGVRNCTSNTGFHILKSHIKNKRLRTHFRCIHPECSHTVTRSLAVGRKAECPFCGEPYILTYEALNLATPHCSSCTAKRKNNKKKPIETIPEELLKLF